MDNSHYNDAAINPVTLYVLFLANTRRKTNFSTHIRIRRHTCSIQEAPTQSEIKIPLCVRISTKPPPERRTLPPDSALRETLKPKCSSVLPTGLE